MSSKGHRLSTPATRAADAQVLAHIRLGNGSIPERVAKTGRKALTRLAARGIITFSEGQWKEVTK